MFYMFFYTRYPLFYYHLNNNDSYTINIKQKFYSNKLRHICNFVIIKTIHKTLKTNMIIFLFLLDFCNKNLTCLLSD